MNIKTLIILLAFFFVSCSSSIWPKFRNYNNESTSINILFDFENSKESILTYNEVVILKGFFRIKNDSVFFKPNNLNIEGCISSELLFCVVKNPKMHFLEYSCFNNPNKANSTVLVNYDTKKNSSGIIPFSHSIIDEGLYSKGTGEVETRYYQLNKNILSLNKVETHMSNLGYWWNY